MDSISNVHPGSRSLREQSNTLATPSGVSRSAVLVASSLLQQVSGNFCEAFARPSLVQIFEVLRHKPPDSVIFHQYSLPEQRRSDEFDTSVGSADESCSRIKVEPALHSLDPNDWNLVGTEFVFDDFL